MDWSDAFTLIGGTVLTISLWRAFSPEIAGIVVGVLVLYLSLPPRPPFVKGP